MNVFFKARVFLNNNKNKNVSWQNSGFGTRNNVTVFLFLAVKAYYRYFNQLPGIEVIFLWDTMENQSFSVIKEKIIKTNELLQLYEDKTSKLAKANRAYKEAKIKYETSLIEINRLQMDNERITYSLNNIKPKYEQNKMELSVLKKDFTTLEEKYQDTLIESQLNIKVLQEKFRQCTCEKTELGAVSPAKKKHLVDERGKELKEKCQELQHTVSNFKKRSVVSEGKNRQLEKDIQKQLKIVDELVSKNGTLQCELLIHKGKVQTMELELEKQTNTLSTVVQKKDFELNLLKKEIAKLSFKNHKIQYLESECEDLRVQIKRMNENIVSKVDFGIQTCLFEPIKNKAVDIEELDLKSNSTSNTKEDLINLEKIKTLEFKYMELQQKLNLKANLAKNDVGVQTDVVSELRRLDGIEDDFLESEAESVTDILKEMALPRALSPMSTSSTCTDILGPPFLTDIKSTQALDDIFEDKLKLENSVPTITITPPTPNIDRDEISGPRFPVFNQTPLKDTILNIEIQKVNITDTNEINENTDFAKDIQQINTISHTANCNKEKPLRHRKYWIPYNFNSFVKRRSRRQLLKSSKLLRTSRQIEKKSEHGDTILNALRVLQQNNINFTISNESIPLIPPYSCYNLISPPKVEQKIISSKVKNTRHEQINCWNKNCTKNNTHMMLRDVPNEKEPELLGFFSVKNEIITPAPSRLANAVKPQPLDTQNILNQLLNGIQELVSEKRKQLPEKCDSRRKKVKARARISDFYSETETELERLFTKSTDVLIRNKRLLKAAKKQNLCLNEESNLESDLDMMVDSGLVTATSKIDDDSLPSFSSIERPDVRNTVGHERWRESTKMISGSPKNILPNGTNNTIKRSIEFGRNTVEIDEDSCDLFKLPSCPSVMLSPFALSSKGSPLKKDITSPLQLGNFVLPQNNSKLTGAYLERFESNYDLDKSEKSLQEKNEDDHFKGKIIDHSPLIKRVLQDESFSKKESRVSSGTHNFEPHFLRNRGHSKVIDSLKSTLQIKSNFGVNQDKNNKPILEKKDVQSDQNEDDYLKVADQEIALSVKEGKVTHTGKRKRGRPPKRKLDRYEKSEEASVCSVDKSSDLPVENTENLRILDISPKRRGTATKNNLDNSKSILKLEVKNVALENSDQDFQTIRGLDTKNKKMFVEEASGSSHNSSSYKQKSNKFKSKEFILESESECDTSFKYNKNIFEKNTYPFPIISSTPNHLNLNEVSNSSVTDVSNKDLFGDMSESEDESLSSTDNSKKIIIKKITALKKGQNLKRKILNQVKSISYLCHNNRGYNSKNQSSVKKLHEGKIETEENKINIVQDILISKGQTINLLSNDDCKLEKSGEIPNDEKDKAVQRDTKMETVPKTYINKSRIGINKTSNMSTPVDILSQVMQGMIKSGPKAQASKSGFKRPTCSLNQPRKTVGPTPCGSNTLIKARQAQAQNSVKLIHDEEDQSKVEEQNSEEDFDCPKSPDIVEVPDKEPKIIPTEKPIRMPPSKVRVIFDKLMVYSSEEKMLDDIISEFAHQEVEYIAEIIVAKVSMDFVDKADNTMPPSPVLTSTQRILLGFMSKLSKTTHPTIYDKFLSMAELALYNRNKCNLQIVQPITRLYTAVCKLRRDLNRIRRFCCEGFYFMEDFAVPMFFTVLTMWAEVLPVELQCADFPLAKVLVQICHLKGCNQPGYNLLPLRDLLHKFFGYPTERWKCDDIFQDILIEYLRNPALRLSDFTLLLFFKNKPTKWVYQKMKENIIPLFEKIPHENSNLKATLVILLANICCAFQKYEEYDWSVILEMEQWFLKLDCDKVPPLLKRSIELALARLPKRVTKRKRKVRTENDSKNLTIDDNKIKLQNLKAESLATKNNEETSTSKLDQCNM